LTFIFSSGILYILYKLEMHMKTHGCAKRAEKSGAYKSWSEMKRRCLDPNRPAYPQYGGRGIKVCERWLDFFAFLEDMGERPNGMSLDRIDNNKGYYKDNCRWATRQEQNNNKGAYRNSTTGVTGVAKNRVVKKGKEYVYWAAWGSVDGKTFRLYHGNDFNAAVEARKKWEHGDEQ
jgi:hypothetical protein